MFLCVFLSADWSREATRPGVPASTQVPETTGPPFCMGWWWWGGGAGGESEGLGMQSKNGAGVRKGGKTNERVCNSESAPVSQGREQLHIGHSVETA